MKRFLGYAAPEGILDIQGPQRKPSAFNLGHYQVFHRGYIANPLTLRSEACARGYRLDQLPDAELFALAYDWWGADLARHVFGEFAVVIYDLKRRLLLLTHDELGLVPLFYAPMNGKMLFASHLEDLAVESGIGKLDEEYIAEYITRGEHFGERTPYTHICRVLPGQSLTWKDGRLTRHDTWTVTSVRPLRHRDQREYEEQLLHLIKQSISSVMPTNAKIWCELSGGLDSSTVLGVAALSNGKNLGAVSFVYPELRTADERKWINVILEKYHVPWHPLNAAVVGPFTEMPEGFCGEPNLSLLMSGHYRAYNELLTRHHVDVVLTGMGGDAVLLGDGPEPFYLADLLRRLRFYRLWKDLKSWAKVTSIRRSLTFWFMRCAAKPLIRHFQSEMLEHDPVSMPWLSSQFSDNIKSHDCARRSYVPRLSSVGDSWFFEGILRCANVVSKRCHERQVDCDFRHPLLYRPLIEYMYSVPWTSKLHPGGDRLLQRLALVGVLPESTLRRRDKIGPDQAFYAGLESSVEWYSRLTQHPLIAERGYVDAARWQQTVHRARLGRTTGIKYFLATACLEIWLQQLECLDRTRKLNLDHPNNHKLINVVSN